MWFGVNYNINPYRGCQHRCIYCDSRASCYRVENFDKDIIVKSNAVELLKKELKRKRKKPVIGFGAMCDPYMPIELKERITYGCLKVLAENGIAVNITTKSNLLLKDVELLREVNKRYLNVAFTITTPKDDISKMIEPYAPLSSERFKAMGILSTLGITVGITLMPLLPYITDKPDDLTEFIKMAKNYGAEYIWPSFGVSLKEGQREYFFHELGKHSQKIKAQYVKSFSKSRQASIRNYKKVKEIFYNECAKQNISTKAPLYQQKVMREQISYFGKF
jgi:DNA repair photolyase